LREQGEALFGDEKFADLFQDVGRRSVAPRIVATVMVMQRLEGLSDREAVEHFAFDIRWKYATGVALDYPSFVHTVLVDMRARLRGSKSPNRIFEAVLVLAKEAGWVGRKRVLDSTALYDAVATQDTVTMIRSSIRALLRLCDASAKSSSTLCHETRTPSSCFSMIASSPTRYARPPRSWPPSWARTSKFAKTECFAFCVAPPRAA